MVVLLENFAIMKMLVFAKLFKMSGGKSVSKSDLMLSIPRHVPFLEIKSNIYKKENEKNKKKTSHCAYSVIP